MPSRRQLALIAAVAVAALVLVYRLWNESVNNGIREQVGQSLHDSADAGAAAANGATPPAAH